ncbi:MAG TPA: hypothetical protein PKH98_06220, partial [Candidatus Omnitrophota bacterium]|nr:hypothetical protein [Candidatus Omnitrophota bacterium]
MARTHKAEWNNVLEKIKSQISSYDVIAKDLENANEYTDFYKIIPQNKSLTEEEKALIVGLFEGFLNELRPANSAVVDNMGLDYNEYHLMVSYQYGDLKYHQAVRVASKTYNSLIAAFRDKGSRIAEEDLRKSFISKYESYQKLVDLKLRQIFQEATLWGGQADRVSAGFNVKMLNNLLNIDLEKADTLTKELISGLIKAFEDRNILKKTAEGKYFVQVRKFTEAADVIFDFRDKNISKVLSSYKNLDNWLTIIQIANVIRFTDVAGCYLPFYDRNLDNPIVRNKNGGIGTNLWLTYGRSVNYDAHSRSYMGQNIWRTAWATLVGRNPDIMIVNPMMKVWTTSNWSFPVTKLYGVSQETWTSEVQRARRGLLTFYGKGLMTPAAGDTMLSPPG